MYVLESESSANLYNENIQFEGAQIIHVSTLRYDYYGSTHPFTLRGIGAKFSKNRAFCHESMKFGMSVLRGMKINFKIGALPSDLAGFTTAEKEVKIEN